MASQSLNATCSICGRKYHLCVSCKDFINLQPYKLHTDTAEHYKIYQILHGYNTGVYNIVETKEKLQLIDLSDINELRDNIKETIKFILAYEGHSVSVKNNEIIENIVPKKRKKENK